MWDPKGSEAGGSVTWSSCSEIEPGAAIALLRTAGDMACTCTESGSDIVLWQLSAATAAAGIACSKRRVVRMGLPGTVALAMDQCTVAVSTGLQSHRGLIKVSQFVVVLRYIGAAAAFCAGNRVSFSFHSLQTLCLETDEECVGRFPPDRFGVQLELVGGALISVDNLATIWWVSCSDAPFTPPLQRAGGCNASIW